MDSFLACVIHTDFFENDEDTCGGFSAWQPDEIDGTRNDQRPGYFQVSGGSAGLASTGYFQVKGGSAGLASTRHVQAQELHVDQKRQGAMAACSSSSFVQLDAEPSSPFLPSRGAALHDNGWCTPCKFFRTRRGCKDGVQCVLCHFTHSELTYSTIRRMMKEHAQAFRASRVFRV
jgi:hypothetical protein